jgi:hypothetical protein
VEDHSLFAQALELVLGQRLADEGDGAEFVRAATVADGLGSPTATAPSTWPWSTWSSPTATAPTWCGR